MWEFYVIKRWYFMYCTHAVLPRYIFKTHVLKFCYRLQFFFYTPPTKLVCQKWCAFEAYKKACYRRQMEKKERRRKKGRVREKENKSEWVREKNNGWGRKKDREEPEFYSKVIIWYTTLFYFISLCYVLMSKHVFIILL